MRALNSAIPQWHDAAEWWGRGRRSWHWRDGDSNWADGAGQQSQAQWNQQSQAAQSNLQSQAAEQSQNQAAQTQTQDLDFYEEWAQELDAAATQEEQWKREAFNAVSAQAPKAKPVQPGPCWNQCGST